MAIQGAQFLLKACVFFGHFAWMWRGPKPQSVHHESSLRVPEGSQSLASSGRRGDTCLTPALGAGTRTPVLSSVERGSVSEHSLWHQYTLRPEPHMACFGRTLGGRPVCCVFAVWLLVARPDEKCKVWPWFSSLVSWKTPGCQEERNCLCPRGPL